MSRTVTVTREPRSGLVEFRPRARLLKLIGAELISDDVLAVTELVKNAHDADASVVTIQFRGVDALEGSITVTDDGCGMDLETLLGRWMEPAGSTKGGVGGRVTPRGRRVLGEKGVGRFAADKLARHLELVSRCRDADHEIRAAFDWDAFDTGARMLADIRNRWEIRPVTEIAGSGTVLRLTGLRSSWNERMFRRLSARLARLRSPFRESDSFTIRIESDEFPAYSGDIRSDVLDRAPYRIEGRFDGEQTVHIRANGSRVVAHTWNGSGDLRCGPLRVRIFAFDLETEALARLGPRMEVRAWLKEWSGISVYRDGFRVWPYGEPHDDWLRLDQRRVNNPVVRLSNNQVVGFVEISRDTNPDLRDQTNREGLLHNLAFEDLRRLMHFVLQVLEAERQSLRHPRTGTVPGGSVGRPGDALPAALERIARRAPAVGKELRDVAQKVKEERSRQEARRRQLEEGYSELAAMGQAAAGFSLATTPLLERVGAECAKLRRVFAGMTGLGIEGSLRAIEASVGAIAERVAMLAPAESQGTRRRRTIDVKAEVGTWGKLLGPLLRASGVRLRISSPRGGLLRTEMLPENLHRLLHILAANSFDWLRPVKTPEIRVIVRRRAARCEIIFSDNGPGIPARVVPKVFEPRFSGKEDGRGMGLTIARNLVGQHGGEIGVIGDRRRRGATIRILLPLSRSRATVHRR